MGGAVKKLALLEALFEAMDLDFSKVVVPDSLYEDQDEVLVMEDAGGSHMPISAVYTYQSQNDPTRSQITLWLDNEEVESLEGIEEDEEDDKA